MRRQREAAAASEGTNERRGGAARFLRSRPPPRSREAPQNARSRVSAALACFVALLDCRPAGVENELCACVRVCVCAWLVGWLYSRRIHEQRADGRRVGHLLWWWRRACSAASCCESLSGCVKNHTKMSRSSCASWLPIESSYIPTRRRRRRRPVSNGASVGRWVGRYRTYLDLGVVVLQQALHHLA